HLRRADFGPKPAGLSAGERPPTARPPRGGWPETAGWSVRTIDRGGFVARILVVGDARVGRARARDILMAAGYEVLEAENGRHAVEVYAQERREAVLMDLMMPEMDGLEALDEIRRQDPAARVAMVTAMGQKGHIVDAIRRGASDFLVKPIQQ